MEEAVSARLLPWPAHSPHPTLHTHPLRPRVASKHFQLWALGGGTAGPKRGGISVSESVGLSWNRLGTRVL